MEEQFLPYELALKLKELGFDENCLARFDGGGFRMLPVYDPLKNNEIKEAWFCVTPLWKQAFDWFLERHGLFIETTLWGDGIGYISQIKQIKQEEFLEVYNLGLVSPNRGLPNWDKKKEDLACLNKLIEIVKEK